MAVAKQALALVKETFKEFSDDEATWKAAALSYFTVFALAPLLVILLQVASLIWDPAQVRDALTGQFQAVMGQEVARQVQTMMMSAEQKTASGTGVRLILSIAGLVFGATGAFVSLQQALNRAWEVEPDPKRGGIRNFITKRFLSLGMVLGIAFLLLVSLAVTAALSAAGDVLFGGAGEAVGHVLNFILTFAIIAGLFAAMFKVLPDAKVGWRDVWVGAVATALFFVVGKFLIGLYIGKSDPGSAFGAAGALAVLLVWIYYAALILLLGAEFTQAWMKMHGRTIEPEEGAIRVVEVKKPVPGPSTPDRAKEKESEREPRAPERAPAFAAAKSDHDHEANHGAPPVRRTGDSVARAKQEIADTRDRMSETVVAIEARVSGTVENVRDGLDPTRLVKEYPWPALAAAVVAGVALGATRADEMVADAAVDATKRASSTAADGVRNLGDAVASRLHNEGERKTDEQNHGLVERAKAGVARIVQTQANDLKTELVRAAEDIGSA